MALSFSEDDMNEETLYAVQDYIDLYLFEPQKNWPKQEIESRSYARWAALELLNRLMDNPLEDPDIVVDCFVMEMAMYSHLGGSNGNRIFGAALDTAVDILRLTR